MQLKGKDKRQIEWWPFFIIFGLLIFSLVMVYDASSAQALSSFKDKYFFLKEQLKWVVGGLLVAGVMAAFDYRRLKTIAVPALVISLVLLVAVFLPGIGVRAYGAHRWLNFGFTVIQPSEIAKLAMIIYLSAWLVNKEKGRLLSFMLLTGLLVGLVLLEPDMGTAIIFLTVALVIYYLSDSEMLGLILMLPLVVLGGIGLAIRSPYRLKRVTTFLDPNSDPLGASYHIRQVLISLGSGGIFGLGMGNSRQKYAYLPEATTDSIFAIIGEELGLIGTSLLLLVLGFLYYRLFIMVLSVTDRFGKILGLGIVFWLAIQTIINLASMVALIPLTGVPLPFISYGGSALLVEMAGVGILVNILRQNG